MLTLPNSGRELGYPYDPRLLAALRLRAFLYFEIGSVRTAFPESAHPIISQLAALMLILDIKLVGLRAIKYVVS